jgi:CRISPR-associated protein Cas2
MYVILVYDVGERRVAKVCKFLRRYLLWVQRSVFEGEVTESQLEAIRLGVKKLINKDGDSIYIYKMRSDWNVDKEIIGSEKSPTENVV